MTGSAYHLAVPSGQLRVNAPEELVHLGESALQPRSFAPREKRLRSGRRKSFPPPFKHPGHHDQACGTFAGPHSYLKPRGCYASLHFQIDAHGTHVAGSSSGCDRLSSRDDRAPGDRARNRSGSSALGAEIDLGRFGRHSSRQEQPKPAQNSSQQDSFCHRVLLWVGHLCPKLVQLGTAIGGCAATMGYTQSETGYEHSTG